MAFEDVAELSGVPEPQLRLVIRMTILAGFLSEPQPNRVPHSPLSAAFLDKPSYLDAVTFLSGTAVPSATSMTTVTRQSILSHGPVESALNHALATSSAETRLRFQRRWSAYARYTMSESTDSTASIVNCFEWSGLGAATVVEVSLGSHFSTVF